MRAFIETMTDIMFNNANQQEQSKFSDTPFRRVDEIGQLSGDRLETALQEARKIYRATDRNGTITTDESIIESLSVPSEHTDAENWYATVVGPIAETHNDLAWLSAYDLSLSSAPTPKSDEFEQAAAELNIPNSRATNLVPKFLRGAYRVLYNHVAEHGRPMHPYLIESEVNVVLTARGYEQAYRYFEQLPGVSEVNRNGPAWALNDSQEGASTAQGESHV